MPTIISPEQFKETFLQVVKDVNNEAELARLFYLQPYRQYTDFMLNTLLPPIAAQLNLKVYREYFQLDAIFYEEIDNVNFQAAQNYAKYIAIAFEHENEIRNSQEEANRLTIYNTPLKILVTYPSNQNQINQKLNMYARITAWADIFSDFSTLRKQLVIFGRLNGQEIRWDFYVYRDGGFVQI